MDAEELSRQIRHGRSKHLALRRGVVALSFVSDACMKLIGLYQVGLIPHLPEPPHEKLDADAVDAAPEAYARLDMPDAYLGSVSYAVTAALAAAGGEDRARTHPWLPIAMAGKAFVDAAQAAKLTRDQKVKHRAYCFWCLTAAGATFVAAALTVPEAMAAWKELREQRGSRENSRSAAPPVPTRRCSPVGAGVA